MSRRTVLILLLFIIVVGIGLRSYQLTSRSLWFDEAFSWRLVQFSYSEMIARDATDVHPPLYYILLKAWSTIFATSLLSLRSFSIFFAALTLLATYLFTSQSFRSPPAGLLATALLALAGWQIQFAWEARMYTLGTALLLLSSWQLILAIRTRKLTNWILYALLTSALSYVHYYAFFSIAAQFIFIAGYILVVTKGRIGEILQSRLAWQSIGALVLLILLFIPWLPTFLAQNSQVQQSYWIPGIGGWSIPDTFYRMFAPTPGIPSHTGLGWITLAILPIASTFIGLILLVSTNNQGKISSPHSSDASWLVFCSATVPFALSILLSFIGQSLYQDRFFVFAHLFIIIALAVLLTRLPLKTLRITTIVLALTASLVAYISYWQQMSITTKPGARAATTAIVERLNNNEPIVVSSPFIYFSILHYATEEHRLLNTPKLYSETGELAHFAGGPILQQSDIIGSSIFKSTDQLWIVDTTGFGSSRLTLPDNWQQTTSLSFPEVFDHQGEVIVSHYIKR